MTGDQLGGLLVGVALGGRLGWAFGERLAQWVVGAL
jgi:hypothetical protein